MSMKALVVEDEGFTREYLATLLRKEYAFGEVIEASDGATAWEIFGKNDFNFIILDLLVPEIDGIRLAKRILEAHRPQRILALSSECDDYTFREVSRSGILGYLCKQDITREVMDQALRKVLSGHVFYSKSVREVMERLQSDSDAYYKVLSDRELHVLRAVAKNKTNEAIAKELDLSPYTVRRHRYNVMQKLGLKNESCLLHFALDKGIMKHKSGLDWSE